MNSEATSTSTDNRAICSIQFLVDRSDGKGRCRAPVARFFDRDSQHVASMAMFNVGGRIHPSRFEVVGDDRSV